MNTNNAKADRARKLLRVTAMHKWKLIFAGFLAILGQASGIIPFYIIYKIIVGWQSGQLQSGGTTYPLLLILAAVVGMVLKNGLIGLSLMVSHIAAYNTLYTLRSTITRKLARFPLGYFSKRNTGQLKKVISEDIEVLELFLAHNVPDVMAAVGHTLVSVVTLLAVDWRMALACMVAMPLAVLMQTMTMGSGKQAIYEWFTQNEKMNNAMVEFIQGIPVIKAFNQTTKSYAKYSGAIEKCHAVEEKMVQRWNIPTALFTACITANIIFIMPLGAYLTLHGSLSLAQFVFCILVSIGFGTPLWVLVQFGRNVERQLEGQTRIWSILETEELPEPAAPQQPGEDFSGRQVSFGYSESVDVLHGVDFSIPKGRFIAMVGPSGAGKTTLARLLPRFWDVRQGCIALGEHDIRDISLNDLMGRFSLIFQNVFLLNDTVRANLKMENASITDEEMVAAAKTAQCHEFISSLPQGYDTIIGERGSRISGGEKQRLSIARALLKKAPVLVLDEATAFIDPENEVLVQKAIDSIVKEKTLIVIAHRISTIIGADEIWVMDQGKIVGRGKHDDLLTGCDLYRHLWDTHTAAHDWTLEGRHA